MTGIEQQSGRLRRILVAATAVCVVIAGGVVLVRLDSHAASLHVDTAASSQRPAATTVKERLDSADIAAAPLVSLGRLSAPDTTGRIALPWRPLTVHNGQARVSIVFASRPSCEHLDGAYVVQTDTSVMINVVASNIANAPNCDVVPRLNRTVITLASPLSARSLVHARLDATYWPANPFDGT